MLPGLAAEATVPKATGARRCDATGWASWTTWPQPLARREPQALAEARIRHATAIHFWQFCQWRFFRQWAALKAYANGKGVRLVGDAPIFIAHSSADAWAHPELFELDPNAVDAVATAGELPLVPADLDAVVGHLGSGVHHHLQCRRCGALRDGGYQPQRREERGV